MNRYRIIEVKYIGPTNYRGSRIKLTDLWLEESLVVGYDHAYNRIEEQAIDILTARGFTVIADSANQIAGTHLLMIDDFARSIRTGK